MPGKIHTPGKSTTLDEYKQGHHVAALNFATGKFALISAALARSNTYWRIWGNDVEMVPREIGKLVEPERFGRLQLFVHLLRECLRSRTTTRTASTGFQKEQQKRQHFFYHFNHLSFPSLRAR